MAGSCGLDSGSGDARGQSALRRLLSGHETAGRGVGRTQDLAGPGRWRPGREGRTC